MGHQNRTAQDRDKWQTLKDAQGGEPEALSKVFPGETPEDAVASYRLFVDDTLPDTFSAENVWTQVGGTLTGTFPRGKFATDVQLAWKLDSNSSRVTAVRLSVNGETGAGYSAQTNSSDDIATVSSFTDFSFEEETAATIFVEAILETGGGAATFSLEESRIRVFLISQTPDSGGEVAQIAVTP